MSGTLEQVSGSGQPSDDTPPGQVKAPWGQEMGQWEEHWCPSGWLVYIGWQNSKEGQPSMLDPDPQIISVSQLH